MSEKKRAIISNFGKLSIDDRYEFARILVVRGEDKHIVKNSHGCAINLNRISPLVLAELHQFISDKLA
jgi:hypothetical protein